MQVSNPAENSNNLASIRNQFSQMNFWFSLGVFFFSFVVGQKPILVPKSQSARPVHEFDFVYLPRETVLKLLPGFTRRELRQKSQKAAQILKIPAPKEPRVQVLAIQKARRLELEGVDPKGQQREIITSRLALLKQQLDIVVGQRNRFLVDLDNLKVEQAQCSAANPADWQLRLKCLTVDDEMKSLSIATKSLNQQERQILKEMFALRKRLNRL